MMADLSYTHTAERIIDSFGKGLTILANDSQDLLVPANRDDNAGLITIETLSPERPIM